MPDHPSEHKPENTPIALDTIDGILNASTYREAASQEMGRAVRYSRPLSVVLLDVEGLDVLGRTYGDDAASEVMRYVATRVVSLLRDPDRIAHLGGHKLGLLLPETSLKRAIAVAEKLRDDITVNIVSTAAGPFRMAISAGVADVSPKLSDADMLLMTADLELFRAKRSGRNQICVARAPAAAPTIANNGLIH